MTTPLAQHPDFRLSPSLTDPGSIINKLLALEGASERAEAIRQQLQLKAKNPALNAGRTKVETWNNFKDEALKEIAVLRCLSDYCLQKTRISM